MSNGASHSSRAFSSRAFSPSSLSSFWISFRVCHPYISCASYLSSPARNKDMEISYFKNLSKIEYTYRILFFLSCAFSNALFRAQLLFAVRGLHPVLAL
jgi:hypothetical protein